MLDWVNNVCSVSQIYMYMYILSNKYIAIVILTLVADLTLHNNKLLYIFNWYYFNIYMHWYIYIYAIKVYIFFQIIK